MNNFTSRYGSLVRKLIAGYAAPTVVALFCATSAAFLIAFEGPRLFLLDDAGYGDSYVLYDVQQFQASGVIYRDLSLPPYTLTAYSPLVYMFYSLPGWIAPSKNPFFGPRLMVVAAYLLCIAMIASLARALIPTPFGWFWSVALVASISSMWDWVLQLRGDFPATFFSLLAIRLLLIESPWAMILAGLAAGLATQFKFTFVAALAAGILVLLARRRWKDLALFAAAGLFASAGLYFLYWLREPRMLLHLTSLRIGFIDPVGCLRLAQTVLAEPIVLLAVAAFLPVARRCSPGWVVLGLFALISFAIALLTDLHPGGNINYFFEALFAIVPAAALGVIRLLALGRRSTAVALFVIALFLLQLANPLLHRVNEAIARGTIGFRGVDRSNESFRQIENALRGRHIFSTVERLALLDPAPALINAFALWSVNPQPIYHRVRSGEFDVVIIQELTWRGVDHVPPNLRSAINAAYTPQCTIRGAQVYVPRNRPGNNDLVQRLNQIGCAPAPGQQDQGPPRS